MVKLLLNSRESRSKNYSLKQQTSQNNSVTCPDNAYMISGYEATSASLSTSARNTRRSNHTRLLLKLLVVIEVFFWHKVIRSLILTC